VTTSWLRRLLATGLLTLPLVPAGAADLQQRDSVLDPSIMRIDEPRHLGQPLDPATRLVDAGGRTFTLGDWLGKPVILLLSYYGCDGSCPTMNATLARVLADVRRFRLGEDYRVLTLSFDSQDTADSAAGFLARGGAVPAAMRNGWRHAVLANAPTEAAGFATGIGFRFFWSQEEKVFLHPNVLVFLTPEGRVARYLYGTRLDAGTVELALIDADWGRIANSTAIFDLMTGACFSYNFAEGRYQPNYSLIAGLASFLSGIGLMGLGAWLYRRKPRGEARHAH
jgi:protein SCO1/2